MNGESRELRESRCEPCQIGAAKVSSDEAQGLMAEIPGWRMQTYQEVDQLGREFRFADFDEAFEFSRRIAALAGEHDHHPAILVEYGKVTVLWWTHKVKGLHRNDFIMAAKTSEAAEAMAKAGN